MIGGLNIAEIKPTHIFELLAQFGATSARWPTVRGSIETIIASADMGDPDFRKPTLDEAAALISGYLSEPLMSVNLVHVGAEARSKCRLQSDRVRWRLRRICLSRNAQKLGHYEAPVERGAHHASE